MKLITALACTSVLLGGAAFAADTSSNATDNNTTTSAPASQTPTATPAQTAKTEHYTKAERTARMEMCSKAASDKGLTGTARKDYMRTCHLEVVPR